MEIQEQLKPVIEHQPDTDVRILRRCDIGRVPVHQGDIYIHRVADDHPRGQKLADRQLALGNTVGSRHFVEGDGVEVFEGAIGHPRNRALLPKFPDDRVRDICTGRMFTAPGPFRIPHPEHALHDIRIEDPGTYQVTYQYDVATDQIVRD